MKSLFYQTFTPMLLEEKKKVIVSKDYIYELKYDGVRALLYVSPTSFKIMSRNKKDLTFLFPELREIQNLVCGQVIFDGEIIALKDGKPSFLQLQKRLHVKAVSKNLCLKVPVIFMAFDILYEDRSLVNLFLLERKRRLNKYENSKVFMKAFVYRDGRKLFSNVKKLGLEGIVCKKKNSVYVINTRSSDWVKVKNIQREVFYIGAYSYKEGTPFVSLYLGEEKKKQLYFVGKVSVSKKKVLEKIKKIPKRKKSVFQNFKEKDVIYIQVCCKCMIEFLEKNSSGKLRHSVFVDFV